MPWGRFIVVYTSVPAAPLSSTNTSVLGAFAVKWAIIRVKKPVSVVASQVPGFALPADGSLMGSKPMTPGWSANRAIIVSHAARYSVCSAPPSTQNASNACSTPVLPLYSVDQSGQSWVGGVGFARVQQGNPSPQKHSE